MSVRYDQAKVTEYREAATRLHELSISVEQQIDSAFENGADLAVHAALSELKVSGAEFKKLRATLTPRELFIAKYNIQVHGTHEVSFVLPQGVSRYEMLCEAQGVVTERNLIWLDQLTEWGNDRTFTDTCRTPDRLRINGHVEGGDGMTTAEQEAFLRTKGLPLVSLEDLAAAFVAHYIATGESLFGWYNKSGGWSFVVRAAGGALYFDSYGLGVRGLDDAASNSFVAVSARVPRNLKS